MLQWVEGAKLQPAIELKSRFSVVALIVEVHLLRCRSVSQVGGWVSGWLGQWVVGSA